MRQFKAAAGFSLVEVMVGMTIGLLTVLVVSQVMQVTEVRRQAASSGADSLVNAGLGLYSIERDGKNAGFGIGSVRDAIGCSVRGTYNGAAITPFTLAPIVITDGAAGAADTVKIIAGNKNGVTLPTKISVDHAKAAAVSSFFVESDIGVQSGDIMIAATSSPTATKWCTLFQVAGAPGGSNQVPHTTASLWNQDPGSSIMPTTGYVVGDFLLNLGTFSAHTYGISSDKELTMTEWKLSDNTNSTQVLFPNVVQLQAVYGKDTNADNIVDAWNATAPTTIAGWQQIRAVRLAIVTRSQTPEVGNVTLDGAAAASTCNSTTPHAAAVCWKPDPAGNGVKIDVSAVNQWQRYRYRVVESTIPLRNVIWQQ